MKLIVQIPCLNEEETLPLTLANIPRNIQGIDKVEVLIIDDGSADRTLEVACEHGVEHIVKFPQTKGLARAFSAGIDASLRLGADIIVNTDGDNQYCGADIPRLVRPILDGWAEMVVGNRQIDTIDDFSWTKKRLQQIGSWAVRRVSGANLPDVTSGFRAFSREAALQMNIVSPFTYSLETIIQAAKKHIAIGHAKIKTNPKTRPSRLFATMPQYLKRSVITIVRIYTMFQPLRVFTALGAAFLAAATVLGMRFFYFYVTGNGQGHIQSVVLSGALGVIGFIILLIGLVADLISFNRKLIEETLYRVRRVELSFGDDHRAARPGYGYFDPATEKAAPRLQTLEQEEGDAS